MKPELKRYYLMQMSYWCQQLLVLVLGLEKPRKDYYELVAHHIVTLWLVGYVCVSFFARRVSEQYIEQLELLDKSHFDWKCDLYEYGYPRHGACRQYIYHAHLASSSLFPQFSKLLNYLQLERAKVVSFAVFVCLWTCVYLFVWCTANNETPAISDTISTLSSSGQFGQRLTWFRACIILSRLLWLFL
jgi:acyl-CoA-dependent ceramide synthase